MANIWMMPLPISSSLLYGSLSVIFKVKSSSYSVTLESSPSLAIVLSQILWSPAGVESEISTEIEWIVPSDSSGSYDTSLPKVINDP